MAGGALVAGALDVGAVVAGGGRGVLHRQYPAPGRRRDCTSEAYGDSMRTRSNQAGLSQPHLKSMTIPAPIMSRPRCLYAS